MDDTTRLQFCLKEIDIVQASIARFDTNGSNIKSWCVTTWSAISAYALTERDPAVACVGLAIVLGFGLLELIYRSFQGRFIRRAAEIETLLGAGELEKYVYSIDKTAARKTDKELRGVLRIPHFTIFYVAFILFSLLIIWYCWKYPINDAHFYLRISMAIVPIQKLTSR
jgi:hypothetical protein